MGTSRAVQLRPIATDLTGTAVASSSVPISSTDKHTLLVKYDPDTNSTNQLVVTVEVSWDEVATADASSTWVQIGAVADTGGTLTFTARQLAMESGAAATYAHWDFEVQGKKLRIKASESNTPGDYGNAEIWLFSREC